MSASVASKTEVKGQRDFGRTRTISVTSGKGGVGKSTLLSNLAVQFAREGKNVLILDGDLGMANIDIMFGVRARSTIAHVLSGEVSIQDIILPVTSGISLIPGGSGVYGLQNMSAMERQILLDQINDMHEHYDVMLIDTASGIDENVLYLNTAAQDILVVLTPDPASLADAYALIKIMNQKFNEHRFSIVTNMVADEREGLRVFKRLSDVTQKFLNVSLDYKGFVPMDSDLRMATKSQQLISREAPDSNASRAIQQLAEKLSGFNHLTSAKGGMQFFWEQLVGRAS